jgi:UDP-glucose 4-epimerase
MAALDIAISRNSRFLYMSSYVYGKPHYLPVDEKHPTSVLNPYMGSKLLGEQMCYQLHQCLDLSVLVLRGFIIYGPQQKDDQLISSIVGSIRNKRSVVVRDPNPKRDYLHISDFLRLIDIIVHSDYSGFEIYNVGGGSPYKNIEVAQMANKLAGNPVPIHVEERARRNDVEECYANIEKVKRDFRWQPEIDLLSGLYDCLSAS